MRKIIVFENMTLDGYVAGANGEIDWAIRDDELTKFTANGTDEVDTFLFGRVTYDMMASFWPTPADIAANKTFADALNNANKIVISHSLDKPSWQNTTTMNEISKDSIGALKQKEGKNIMIFGSISIVNTLAALSLIDEYEFILNPVVLGQGKPLFTSINHFSLTLQTVHAFKAGTVFLRYQP